MFSDKIFVPSSRGDPVFCTTSDEYKYFVSNEGGRNMARILFLAGDFVEDYELMVPFQTLQVLGYDVDVVCPGKSVGETIKTAIHDFEGDQTYTEKPGHVFTLNADFENLQTQKYFALLIPGGRAPEYIRLHPEVIRIVKEFAANGRAIAAVCHGPQVLVAADVIKGKKISAYPACAPEVKLAGAEYVELAMDQAITCENFVTAPAWPAHPEWLRQFAKLLKEI